MIYFRRVWWGWRKLSIELQLLVGGVIVWVVGLAMGLPVLPVTTQQIVLSTYIIPLAIALTVQLIVFVILRRYQRDPRPYLLLYGLPMFMGTVYLFYQFKSWTPLINPHEHDAQYQRIDNALWFLRDGILAVREWVAAQLAINIDNVYYYLFVLMFLVAFTVYGVIGTIAQQRRLMVGLSIALLMGGLSYWIAPAVGPFIYRNLAGEGLAQAQQTMLTVYRSIYSANTIPSGYFGVALGAMPSMHFGFVVFFLLFTLRTKPWLVWWYMLTSTWFLIDSVYLGWHYLIDIPGGAVVAVTAYYLARQWTPDPSLDTVGHKVVNP